MEKRTALVLTTDTDRPFTKVEYENKERFSTTYIPVREVSGTLLEFTKDSFSGSRFTVATKEHGPVEVLGVDALNYDKASRVVVIGEPINLAIAENGRTVSVGNAFEKYEADKGFGAFPSFFTTKVEMQKYTDFTRDMGHRPIFEDVKDFLQLDPRSRDFNGFFEWREEQSIKDIHNNPALVTAVRDDKGKLHNIYIKAKGQELVGVVESGDTKARGIFSGYTPGRPYLQANMPWEAIKDTGIQYLILREDKKGVSASLSDCYKEFGPGYLRPTKNFDKDGPEARILQERLGVTLTSPEPARSKPFTPAIGVGKGQNKGLGL